MQDGFRPLSHGAGLRRRQDMSIDDIMTTPTTPTTVTTTATASRSRAATDRPSFPAGGDPHAAIRDPGRRSDVHVVGGGLGGLAAAALVAHAGLTVTVHEQRGAPGGRATTTERHGYHFNQGPHAFYRTGEAAHVLGRLGIRPSGVGPGTQQARMLRDGELHVAPGDVRSLARTRLLGLREKAELARLLARLPRLDPATLGSRTTTEWVDGLTDCERVRAVLHAVVRLVAYVDGPDHLSADVALVQLQRGLGGGVLYLDRGWQQLVDRLAAAPGVRVQSGRLVRSLADLDEWAAGGVGAAGGPAVIVATGGPRTAAAVTGHPYADGWEATAATLDLGLTGPPPLRFVIGVDQSMYLSEHGVAAGMVPASRASISLARYHSVGADGRDRGGGGVGRGTHRADHDRLRAFARHAGIADEDVIEERYLHRMSVVTSIATAATGGLAGRPPVAVPDRPGVFVVGDWVGPHGHLADAVLASAEAAAQAAVAHVGRRSVVR